MILSCLFAYVREKIRTPDTLVRSQVLYPAELHAHLLVFCLPNNECYFTPIYSNCQQLFQIFFNLFFGSFAAILWLN